MSLPTYPDIEALLPHRGKMLLIDEIVQIDGQSAVSHAIPTDQWPMNDRVAVSSLMLIELVAQTSGLSNGLACLNVEGPQAPVNGRLVGIKKAHLKVAAVALGAVVVTETQNCFEFEDFREIEGRCRVGDQVVAEVTLQVVRVQ
jgi:predicted hotdog family 3-hydroxylacyl-ACP dehydratase